MARKPFTSPNSPTAGKTRTREHVIASQSITHVEKFITTAGHTAERFVNDYGYDLSMYTYEPTGEVEPGNVYFQVKATDNLRVLRDGKTISFPIESADIALWRREAMPVILVVHDTVQKVAYWLYVQELLETSARFQAASRPNHMNLHLSKDNIINEQAIERFRDFKRIVLSQTQEVKHHG